jgi:hypothetical protein
MDWLLDMTSDPFKELGYMELLPDVAESPTPAHGGTIVVKCLQCRASARAVKESRSRTEKAIIMALKKTSVPLSGREIADRASLKYNANFRAMLARLVSRSIVIKVYGNCGYALPNKHLS